MTANIEGSIYFKVMIKSWKFMITGGLEKVEAFIRE